MVHKADDASVHMRCLPIVLPKVQFSFSAFDMHPTIEISYWVIQSFEPNPSLIWLNTALKQLLAMHSVWAVHQLMLHFCVASTVQVIAV